MNSRWNRSWRQSSFSSRSPRYPQRFFTGLALGLILALVCGWFSPLLAQSPRQAVSSTVAQFPAEGSESEYPRTMPLTPPIPPGIADHWTSECLQALALRRALPIGRSAGDDVSMPFITARFNPDAQTSWAFLTELLNRSFPNDEAYGGATAAETALQLSSPINVLFNYPVHYYSPDRAITRAEAVNALAAKAKLPFVARAHEVLALSLEDGRRVPDFSKEGVAAALQAGVLVNYPEAQQLQGDRLITQGEAAALVCQASGEPALQATIKAEWVAQTQELPPQPEPNTEVRGVWLTNIDSDVLFSQSELAEGIQRLKAMHINTLYPVVWNMGYTQYPSEVGERLLGRKQRLWPGENPAFEQAQGDRDMLQELIELAHAEDMAVIPWFEFGFMAPANYAIRAQHPDWFTQRQDGTAEIQMGAEVFTWMNPFHPQTRRLLLLLMAEVLENYDVQGIQVDDHLGLPVDMGYDPFTVALYQQEHGGESPPTDEHDPDWMRWRANKISEFMGDVRTIIDQRKPTALLSVSPNPYPFSYAQYLQDWPAWEAAGILDEIIIQVYRDNLDQFVWELNKPATVRAQRRTPTAIGLLSGLRGRPTDVELLTQQLEAVRDRSYAGVSYFFYQSLWTPGQETAEERGNQFRASFSKSVERP